VEIVTARVGGEIQKSGKFDTFVRGTAHDDYEVVFDSRLLKGIPNKESPEESDPASLGQSLEDMFVDMASLVVHVELVASPLPLSKTSLL